MLGDTPQGEAWVNKVKHLAHERWALRTRLVSRRCDTASLAAWLGWPAPMGSAHTRAREAARVRKPAAR
jgi:hypothetical protein